jgi:ABC-2 type transport system permease protein
VSALLAYGRFEVTRLLRSWKFLVITVGFPVVFYMLFLSDHSAGRVIDGAVPWRTYLMVSMCCFGILVAGLTAGGGRLSSERASGWDRQLQVTPLPAWSYVLTKLAATMVVALPVIALVELVGGTFGGVELSASHWCALTVALWLSTVPFAALGLLVGFTVGTEAAFPVVTALMFVVGYFGGLFNPVSTMPAALRLVARVLPSYHAQALGLSLLDGRGPAPSDVLVLVGYVLALCGAMVVRQRRRPARRRVA